ncbi:hypothetical protein BC1G_04425 [Paecilomyces variotii No. 5]|uniref:FAD-binding domain-containing protein n=1 Tax=Byssochlamys spectabilis (strain No. 5 / NBRC 109023) TaxID=1356009 RepID=V5G8Z2_BYSSN|nr:hypothetical protein BC1G_04425 [Paecilomyces variotii No. 5]
MDDEARYDEAALIPRIWELLKIPDLEMNIHKICHWVIEGVLADSYRKGRVFLAGDAGNRRPPTTGLAERRAIGRVNRDWGLFTFRNSAVINTAMGLVPGQIEVNRERFQKLFEDTDTRRSFRAQVARIISSQNIEFCSHGIELGFRYKSGFLINDRSPPAQRDPLAFFERSYDSVFGLVYRPEFEYQLRLHFSGTHDDDAANYALRNAVYAVGCRAAALADPGKDFVEVQQLSSRYFYNAFSVHADLLFMPSSLVGVRALIVMVIDDDDISCEIPNTIPDGSTIDIEVFTASIKHAQVCSQILKGLFSARGFRQSSEKLFTSMDILERRLQEWRDSLPRHLFPSEIEPVSHLSSQKCRLNIIRLHSFYYGSVVVLHAILHYPWICSLLLNRREELHCDKVSYSSAQAAIASRKILSSLRYVTPDFGSSQLIVFYYPMLAIINLFIYILKYPTASTVRSDQALLDIAAGHFGQIHLLTSSQVSFAFPRNAIRITQRVIERATAKTGSGESDDFNDTFDALSADLFDMPITMSDADASFPSWNELSTEIFNAVDFSGVSEFSI